jgi:hypothetical protein
MGHPRSVRKTRLLSGTCLPFAARCRVVRPAEGHEAHAGPASSGDALRPAICRREGSVARPSGKSMHLRVRVRLASANRVMRPESGRSRTTPQAVSRQVLLDSET